MHVLTQVKLDRFGLSTYGREGFIDDVFPAWHRHDRFGIVIDEAFGGMGASLMILLSVAMFYEVDPTRRGRTYPESYAFHVGGMKGSLAGFDIFPFRKEVEVPDDPAAILDAINDRGITRLAVVDGPIERPRLHHAEPDAALDRIVSAFAYSPSGRVADGEVQIAALDDRLTENVRCILEREKHPELLAEVLGAGAPVRPDEDMAYPTWPRTAPPEVREPVARRREALVREDGVTVESYRRIRVSDALGMLGSRASQPAAEFGADA